MISRSLGHRAPLLWLVLPFIAGLAAGKIFIIGSPPLLLSGAVAVAVYALASAWRGWPGWAPALVVTMVLCGLASYALHRVRLPAWDSLPPREARLSLEVERVFASQDPRRASGLARVVAADEHLGDLVGQRLYFSLNLRRGEARPVRSAELATVGVLVTLPRNPPVDTFDGYLAGAGMNFRLTRGQVLTELSPAHAYYRFCDRAAERFNAILGLGIEEKHPGLAGLLRAMMLGQTHELSSEQRTLFMQSGTMHLFAISGLNIGVIAGALHFILALLRLPAWGRLIIGAGLLWLFVDITGASPSAVRAFVMATFVHAAFVLRQPRNALAALAASAFAVLLVAPLQVFSASFLMSYGIVAALLVLGLPLGDAWVERWTPWRLLPKPTWRWWHHAGDWIWRWLALALAIGVATTLIGLVTGVQFFGLLTPGALVANLVLIPLAMLATLAGFISMMVGLTGIGMLAIPPNQIAAGFLWCIERLVEFSAKVPGVYLPAKFISPWVAPTLLVSLLALLLAGYGARWRGRRWWLPPFALVALALVFGVSYP